VSHGVWMGTTEVTQAQFEAVMGFNPSHYEGCPSCPVERESWGEAATFTGRLSTAMGYPGCYDCRARTEAELDDLHDDPTIDDEFAYRGCRYICDDQLDPYGCGGFRLPTEAEWEYAARGGERYGSLGDFTDGGVLPKGEGECELCPGERAADDLGTPLSELMWYGCSSLGHTEPVARLAPNVLGLYDTSGNVFEWCNDSWDLNDYSGDGSDPVGDTERDFKVLRGGAYDTPAYQSTLGHRWMDPADSCYVYRLGFRVAMTGV
jgi:formylglycine-generating enzyme required for sulfatase activity